MFRSRPTRIISLTLSLVLFATNTLFAGLTERSVWERRKKAVHVASLPGGARLGPPNPSPLPLRRPLVDGPSAAAPDSSSELSNLIALFSSHATLRGVQRGDPSAAGPVVISVQDIHGHAAAQKNIAELILAVLEKDARTLIGLEGSEGPMPMDAFRQAEPAINREAGSFLLNAGLISGPEFAGFASPSPATFIGLEDADRYRENVRAVRSALAQQRPALLQIGRELRWLEEEKKKVYSPALLAFDHQWRSYIKGRVRLGDYLIFLDSVLPVQDSDLALLLSALRLERSLDFARAERERDRFLAGLAESLPQTKLDQLYRDSLALRAGRLPYPRYYRDLRALAASAGLSLNRFPEFDRYVGYIIKADSVRPTAVLSALARYEKQVGLFLCRTPYQRRLVRASIRTELARKLARLTLTPDEWRAHQRYPARAHLRPFERFYAAAEARNDAIVSNLIEGIAAHRTTTAVVVAGGFHSEGLNALLKERGATVLTVTPRLSDSGPQPPANYLEVFTRAKTPLEKLFESPRLTVVMSRATHSVPDESGRPLNPAAEAVRALTTPLATVLSHVAIAGQGLVETGAVVLAATAEGRTIEMPRREARLLIDGKTEKSTHVRVWATREGLAKSDAEILFGPLDEWWMPIPFLLPVLFSAGVLHSSGLLVHPSLPLLTAWAAVSVLIVAITIRLSLKAVASLHRPTHNREGIRQATVAFAVYALAAALVQVWVYAEVAEDPLGPLTAFLSGYLTFEGLHLIRNIAAVLDRTIAPLSGASGAGDRNVFGYRFLAGPNGITREPVGFDEKYRSLDELTDAILPFLQSRRVIRPRQWTELQRGRALQEAFLMLAGQVLADENVIPATAHIKAHFNRVLKANGHVPEIHHLVSAGLIRDDFVHRVRDAFADRDTNPETRLACRLMGQWWAAIPANRRSEPHVMPGFNFPGWDQELRDGPIVAVGLDPLPYADTLRSRDSNPKARRLIVLEIDPFKVGFLERRLVDLNLDDVIEIRYGNAFEDLVDVASDVQPASVLLSNFGAFMRAADLSPDLRKFPHDEIKIHDALLGDPSSNLKEVIVSRNAEWMPIVREWVRSVNGASSEPLAWVTDLAPGISELQNQPITAVLAELVRSDGYVERRGAIHQKGEGIDGPEEFELEVMAVQPPLYRPESLDEGIDPILAADFFPPLDFMTDEIMRYAEESGILDQRLQAWRVAVGPDADVLFVFFLVQMLSDFNVMMDWQKVADRLHEALVANGEFDGNVEILLDENLMDAAFVDRVRRAFNRRLDEPTQRWTAYLMGQWMGASEIVERPAPAVLPGLGHARWDQDLPDGPVVAVALDPLAYVESLQNPRLNRRQRRLIAIDIDPFKVGYGARTIYEHELEEWIEVRLGNAFVDLEQLVSDVQPVLLVWSNFGTYMHSSALPEEFSAYSRASIEEIEHEMASAASLRSFKALPQRNAEWTAIFTELVRRVQAASSAPMAWILEAPVPRGGDWNAPLLTAFATQLNHTHRVERGAFDQRGGFVDGRTIANGDRPWQSVAYLPRSVFYVDPDGRVSASLPGASAHDERWEQFFYYLAPSIAAFMTAYAFMVQGQPTSVALAWGAAAGAAGLVLTAFVYLPVHLARIVLNPQHRKHFLVDDVFSVGRAADYLLRYLPLRHALFGFISVGLSLVPIAQFGFGPSLAENVEVRLSYALLGSSYVLAAQLLSIAVHQHNNRAWLWRGVLGAGQSGEASPVSGASPEDRKDMDGRYEAMVPHGRPAPGRPMYDEAALQTMRHMFVDDEGVISPIGTDILSVTADRIPGRLRAYVSGVVKDWIDIVGAADHYVVDPDTYHISLYVAQDRPAVPGMGAGVLKSEAARLTQNEVRRFAESLIQKAGASAPFRLVPRGVRTGPNGFLILIFDYEPNVVEFRKSLAAGAEGEIPNRSWARPSGIISMTIFRHRSNVVPDEEQAKRIADFFERHEDYRDQPADSARAAFSIDHVSFSHETRWMHTGEDMRVEVPLGKANLETLDKILSHPVIAGWDVDSIPAVSGDAAGYDVEAGFLEGYLRTVIAPFYKKILVDRGTAEAKSIGEDKGDGTPVTKWDGMAEDIFYEDLTDQFPDDGFLGEEGAERRTIRPRTWFVDPIDGTASLIRYMAGEDDTDFGTLAALFEEGSVRVAGGYWPQLDLDGKGFTLLEARADSPDVLLNGHPVEARPDLMKASKTVLIGTYPHGRPRLAQALAAHFEAQGYTVVPSKASGGEIARMMIRGDARLFIHVSPGIVDSPANAFFAEKLGLVVTDLDNRPLFPMDLTALKDGFFFDSYVIGTPESQAEAMAAVEAVGKVMEDGESTFLDGVLGPPVDAEETEDQSEFIGEPGLDDKGPIETAELVDVTPQSDATMARRTDRQTVEPIRAVIGQLQRDVIDKAFDFEGARRVLNRRLSAQVQIAHDAWANGQRDSRLLLLNAAYLAGRAGLSFEETQAIVGELMTILGEKPTSRRAFWKWLQGRVMQPLVIVLSWAQGIVEVVRSVLFRSTDIALVHVDDLARTEPEMEAEERMPQSGPILDQIARNARRGVPQILVARTVEGGESPAAMEKRLKETVESELAARGIANPAITIVLQPMALIRPGTVLEAAKSRNPAWSGPRIRLKIYTPTLEQFDLHDSVIRFLVFSLSGARFIPVSTQVIRARVYSINA